MHRDHTPPGLAPHLVPLELEPRALASASAAPHPLRGLLERLAEILERLESAGRLGPHRMADAIPFRDRLLVGWADIGRYTGLSRRLLEREAAARKMPRPDARVGRRACWRPATIIAWVESLDKQAPGRGGRA